LVLAHLFVKVPRPGDRQGIFRSESQAAPVTTCLTIKGTVNCLAEGHKQTCRLIFNSSHYLF